MLTFAGIRDVPLSELEVLIRSSGYFRQKAARLKIFVSFVDGRYGGSLTRMFSQPTEKLRHELLELNGVGPETADSILLYAGQHPVFVVDAYTRRILERHRICSADTPYEEIRFVFERALETLASADLAPQALVSSSSLGPMNTFVEKTRPTHCPSAMSLAKRSSVAQIYNDMHGLVVSIGKQYCLKSKAVCEKCPLQSFLPAPLNRRVKGMPGRH